MIREINRPGTETLIDYIDTTNYFTTAQCYSHHKYEGGLVDHSLEVLDAMLKNNDAGLSSESITVAALFHDLGKATVDGKKFSSSFHPIRSLQILNHCGYELTKEEAEAKAMDLLERVGLGDKLKNKPSQLSGGQMQRVALARALVNDPEIILADEPTGALDTETSVQIMDILKEISKDKLIIMVTHNPELAETYSTRIVLY